MTNDRPIASCDGVGDSNTSLLMRVARADGILLKPERPAVALDALWYLLRGIHIMSY